MISGVTCRFALLPQSSLRTAALRIFLACLFALFAVPSRTALAAEGTDLWRGVHRFSYETVSLTEGEDMGLAGYGYLVDLSSHLYAGLGVYGSVAGDRGGFLTGGVEAGARLPILEPLVLEAGLFVGGGGGRGAAQGGGLMVRPHAGLFYTVRAVRAGLEYATVDFPNGGIRSDHLAVVLDVPFEALRFRWGDPNAAAAALEEVSREGSRGFRFERERFTARYQVYAPDRRALNTDGTTPTGTFQTAGFEYSRDVSSRLYLFFETAGAGAGDADGYAEVLLGGGARVPLFEETLFLDGRISFGAAGGGRVDTGGGGLGKASVGLLFPADGDLSVDVRAGYALSDGTFRAQFTQAGVSYAFDALVPGSGSGSRLPDDGVRILSWRTRLTCVHYATLQPDMRKGGERGDISLLGVKVDLFPRGETLYLTGQAQSAYAGHAGGYSIGLMGFGFLSGPLAGSPVHIFAEALGGVAGGGGIDVGGGGVVQPAAGVVIDLGERLGIELSAGRITALHGDLDSSFAGFSLLYKFATAAAAGADSVGSR